MTFKISLLVLVLPPAALLAQDIVPTNKGLAEKLELICDLDQKHRTTSNIQLMMKQDSLNVIEVTQILDQHGWLGPQVVGKKGNTAIFLVIQHADISIQEKYLPMMQDAVKKKNARTQDLALLEDRILMRHGKKQLYGSQVVRGKEGNWVFHPIEDAANVDKRRAEIGLEPMATYATHFGITWNLEEHLKQQKEGN